VHDDRAAALDHRVGRHRRVQPLHGIGLKTDVGIHQQHESARRFGDADVSSGTGAVVFLQAPHTDARPLVRNPVAGAVGARDVDDRDAIGGTTGLRERRQRRRQDREVVVRDDRDVDVVWKTRHSLIARLNLRATHANVCRGRPSGRPERGPP
jgi:hypothetical protein